MDKRSVLVLVNPAKDEDLLITKEIIAYLKQKNCDVYIEDILNCKLMEKEFNINTFIDFAVVLGGDGTLLNKLHKYIECDFPFFGINLGRVGCLTEASKEDFREKINCILNGKFYIEIRNALECKILKQGKEYFNGVAFNEVCIDRAILYKMLKINLYVNKRNKTSFYADGVIVATSTGSSAYNLSCGGPLLIPSAKNFVITPISPQLKCITSLIVNDTDEISIDISEQTRRQFYHDAKPIVVIDGKSMIEIDEESKIILKKRKKDFKIIKVNYESSLFEPTFKATLFSQELFNK